MRLYAISFMTTLFVCKVFWLYITFCFTEVKMMRELFTAPEAEVVTFAAQDIVTVSLPPIGPGLE